jgi:hypothetical protein
MQISGTVTVPFQGKDYEVRAAFAFIERVEKRVNILRVAQLMGMGDVRISDIAWIIWSALMPEMKDVSYEDVGEEVAGNLPLYAQVSANLIEACLTNRSAQEEPASKKKALPRKR